MITLSLKTTALRIFISVQQDRSALLKNCPLLVPRFQGKNSYVALCRLNDYIKMISDEEGDLITPLFEANVRANPR